MKGAFASHKCPRFNIQPAAICGLSLLLVLAQPGELSPGTPVLTYSLLKKMFPNAISTWMEHQHDKLGLMRLTHFDLKTFR